jgi:hypothetical protein
MGFSRPPRRTRAIPVNILPTGNPLPVARHTLHRKILDIVVEGGTSDAKDGRKSLVR